MRKLETREIRNVPKVPLLGRSRSKPRQSAAESGFTPLDKG